MREWSEGIEKYRVSPEDEEARDFLASRGHDLKEAWQPPYEDPDGVIREGFWMKVIESRDTVDGMLCWHQLAVSDLSGRNPERTWEQLADMLDAMMERLRKDARKQCSVTDCYEPGHLELPGQGERTNWFCKEHEVWVREMAVLD